MFVFSFIAAILGQFSLWDYSVLQTPGSFPFEEQQFVSGVTSLSPVGL